jgi:predicted  nucleic acid-binding Zn-ribbon protein
MAQENEAFEAVIDRLAALQEFDQKLKERIDQVDALVAEADSRESELEARRRAVAELSQQRDALEKQRAEMDAKLEIDGAKVRDNRMRLNRVRNDRELLALQREIDLGREAAQVLEEELILVMENLERVTAQLNEAQAALAEIEASTVGEIAERRQEAARLSEGLDGERAARENLAGGIDVVLRRKYEQIFSRRGGSAVVEARGGICLGCHINLPPQMFNELQRYREVRQCPSCHRIVFWRSSDGKA